MNKKNIDVVALITARGGSKGIINKNIQNISGQPLIYWTIKCAIDSDKFSKIIVSTDDKQIAKLSNKFGAEVPFLRPPELALDNSPHIDVVIHAINWLNDNGYNPDYIMLLQPTSPLREVDDIENVYNMAINYNYDSIVSVGDSPNHPYIMKIKNEKGFLSNYIDIPKGYIPRQSFPKLYYVNGAIYMTKTQILLDKKTFFSDQTVPYVMPKEKSIDIDTKWDLYLCDLILNDKIKVNK